MPDALTDILVDVETFVEEQGIRHVDVQEMISNGQTVANVPYIELKQVLSSETQTSELAPFLSTLYVSQRMMLVLIIILDWTGKLS